MLSLLASMGSRPELLVNSLLESKHSPLLDSRLAVGFDTVSLMVSEQGAVGRGSASRGEGRSASKAIWRRWGAWRNSANRASYALVQPGAVAHAMGTNLDLSDVILACQSDDEDEIEDMTIKPSDLLILTARNEDDVSHLEVWIYEDLTEDGTRNTYVHHDVMLPAFPLSLAWLDCDFKGGEKGNYVAVGTMQPEIEIWDLDILDAVEPAVVLGGYKQCSSSKSHSKKKKKKVAKLKEGSHSDAVLCLAWNDVYRNVLASGSADSSIKVWDIVTQKCEHTICSHSDKVQAVAWNKHEPTILLSGAFDHTLLLVCIRIGFTLRKLFFLCFFDSGMLSDGHESIE
ncbi:hypothetical protein L7F22_064482 [Adiantum nelumboides]|nr:hypothetical protein [Adiantum nelumboides]